MDLKHKKILIIGASSDLAVPLNEILFNENSTIGFHFNKNKNPLLKYPDSERIRKFQKNLDSQASCYKLVDEFMDWSGGIDCLVQLSGNIKRSAHWEYLTEKDWVCDLSMNLIMPFFLAQRVIKYMKDTGGRIIFTSTASASHGGGTTSLAYGIAKAGVECMVKRLARDSAKYNILVNAIAPGFILTKFHTEKMKRSQKKLQERIKLIPLNREGTPEEVANTIMFLLSENASYITGQIIEVSGGEWL